MAESMSIESHEDDSVTLRAGSITARITGDSWKDANRIAHVLGGLVIATYEAADVSNKLRAMRDHLRELERLCDAAEEHTRAVVDYAYSVRAATEPKSTAPRMPADGTDEDG